MPGPALEDGELEDGEVHEDRPAEMEESGEASGCEGVVAEDEHGTSVTDHQQQPIRASSAHLPLQPSPLPPPPLLQPSITYPAPMRNGRLSELVAASNGATSAGGGSVQSKGRSRASAHDPSAGTGRSRSKTAEGQTAPQSYQPTPLPLSPQSQAQQLAAASAGGGGSVAGGGRDLREDREAEELVALLRDLTRGSTFQDVMRSLETVSRDLKQAIKKLDKLFRRVKKRKGDSIEDYPDCFQFSRRILEGLHTVNKFSQTSAFQAAPPSGADAARALFKAAMNYRHDICNPALKLELEALVRNSKAFKCVLDNRRTTCSNQQGPTAGGTGSSAGGGPAAAALAAEAGPGPHVLAASVPVAAGTGTGADGRDSGGGGGAVAGDQELLPPLPPPPGDAAGPAPESMDVAEGLAAAVPPPPRGSQSVSPGPDPEACVVPAPPPPEDWQHQQQLAAASLVAVGPGAGSAGGGGRSMGRIASSVAGGSSGGAGGGYKLKIVVASTAGDLRAAAAAAGAPMEEPSGAAASDACADRPGSGRRQSPQGGRAGYEPAAKRSRTSASAEPDGAGRGNSGVGVGAAAACDSSASEVSSEVAGAHPPVHAPGPLPAALLRWSMELGDLGAVPPPPESPVSEAGGEGEGGAWDQHGLQARPVPPQQLLQPSVKQEPPDLAAVSAVATGSGTGASGSGGAAGAPTRASAGEHEAGSAPGGQAQGLSHPAGSSHSDREREREKDRERGSRDKDGRDKERDRDKDRERERDRERHRSSKDKERDKERDKDKERDNGGGSSHRASRHRDREAAPQHPPLPPLLPPADVHIKQEAHDGGMGPAAPPSAVPAAFSGGSIRVSEEVASCLARSRLVLVVDLDGVLADSCWDAQLDGPAAAALSRRAVVESAALPEERRELFRLQLDGGALWLKLRPGARAFLTRATERFELWARTRQGRPYADAVVELLDPSQQLFGSRVVAQGVLARRLLAALDARAPIAAVLDTPEAGWMGEQLAGNLMPLPPYSYFAYRPCAAAAGGAALASSGMTGRPLLEVDRDECPERGVLAAALQLLESLHGRVLQGYGAGGAKPSCSGPAAGAGAAAGCSSAATEAPAAGPVGSQQAAFEPWDVRRVLREQRARILTGAHVTFSRVFSGGAQAVPQHPLWRLAEACGATVSATCSDNTTHVVSLSSGTEKAIWAQQHGRFVVFPSWLECSCYMWRKADEALFLV